MTALNTELTANELRAALILVSECLAGMGGQRPADLEHDEYTWCEAKTLQAHGYSAPEANGTFGALIAKGFIYEADRNEMAMTTAAWQYLDSIWDFRGEALVAAKIDEPKMTQTPNQKETKMFNVTATSANGLNFTGLIAASNPGEAIKEMRAAVKLAQISRKVGRIDFRARKAG